MGRYNGWRKVKCGLNPVSIAKVSTYTHSTDIEPPPFHSTPYSFTLWSFPFSILNGKRACGMNFTVAALVSVYACTSSLSCILQRRHFKHKTYNLFCNHHLDYSFFTHSSACFWYYFCTNTNWKSMRTITTTKRQTTYRN